jgi:hypothetical protein
MIGRAVTRCQPRLASAIGRRRGLLYTASFRARLRRGASHWCAPLCGFSEAVLQHGLLLESLRPGLEACLPELRACRQLLVMIPASREASAYRGPTCSDVETLGRLRRVHVAFGEALARSRGLESSMCWIREPIALGRWDEKAGLVNGMHLRSR